jgi:hypothetical protein
MQVVDFISDREAGFKVQLSQDALVRNDMGHSVFRDDIKKWLAEKFAGKKHLDYMYCINAMGCRVRFRFEEDAILFKLSF